MRNLDNEKSVNGGFLIYSLLVFIFFAVSMPIIFSDINSIRIIVLVYDMCESVEVSLNDDIVPYGMCFYRLKKANIAPSPLDRIKSAKFNLGDYERDREFSEIIIINGRFRVVPRSYNLLVSYLLNCNPEIRFQKIGAIKNQRRPKIENLPNYNEITSILNKAKIHVLCQNYNEARNQINSAISIYPDEHLLIKTHDIIENYIQYQQECEDKKNND